MKRFDKKYPFRMLTVLLLVFVLLTGVFMEAKASPNTSYTLTGNQAEDVLTVAKAQIGKTRSDFGWTVDWCGYFTGWSGYTAGAAFPSTKTYWANGRMITYWFVKNNRGTFYYFRDANYDSLISHHKDLDSAALSRCIKSNRSSFVPQKGDIILFRWDSAASNINWSHVGLVESCSNGTITTIEGNVNNKVVRTSRKLSDTQVVAFVRPNYADNSDTKPVLTIRFNAEKNNGTPYVSSDEFSMDDSGYIIKNGTRDLTAWELGYGYPSGLYNADSFGLKNNDSWVFVGWEYDGNIFDEDKFYLAEQICPELKDGSTFAVLYARWEDLCTAVTGMSGLYTLRASNSENMYLTVADGSDSSGANIQINEAAGSSSQIFHLEELAGQSGVYTVTSFASGLSLNASGVVSGSNVDQESVNGSTAQQWMLINGGGDMYFLSPKNDLGLLMGVDDAFYAEDANVSLDFRTFDHPQRWTLKALTGWQKIDGVWYYINSDASVSTGWQKISGKWYYFDETGVMQTGWTEVGSNWYYLNASGVMQTGWLKVGNNWYYLNTSGVMQTGWLKVGNNWYYLNTSGVMQTGWLKIGNNWYYLNTSGVMQTGWTKVGSSWYYMKSSGAMQTGWLKLGGNWYYLKFSGIMAADETLTIAGKTYRFNAKGIWVK